MILRSIVQIIAILSVSLYFIATEKYSYTFDLTCLVLYVISSIAMLLNNCKTTIMKYEFFFSLAFFLTNFVYTTIYFNTDIFSIIFSDSYMPQYFNKGTALSLIGGAFFNLGVFDKKCSGLKTTMTSVKRLFNPHFLLIALMLGFLPYLYGLALIGDYTTEFEESMLNGVLMCFIYYSLFASFNNAATIPSTIGRLWKISTISNLLILIYVLLFLSIGSRTLPLRIILIALFFFDIYIRKFNKKEILIVSAIGLFLMAFVRFDRTGGTMDGIYLLNLGDDLIGCNRTLHYVMDYVSHNGYSYGLTLIITIISIVPHGATIFSELTGLTAVQLNSAVMVTKLYGRADQGGLGTTIIADLYWAFGMVGVLVMMYVLGRVIKKIYKECCKGRIPYILLYALFMMDAVYINRSMYFVSATFMAWTFMLYMMFNKIMANNKKMR